jgi:hypothetical protein
MDMKSVTRNGRSLYRAKEVSKYMSDLVGIQKGKWDRGSTESADEYFSMERGTKIMNLIKAFLCISESYRELGGLSLLLIGYHTQY